MERHRSHSENISSQPLFASGFIPVEQARPRILQSGQYPGPRVTYNVSPEETTNREKDGDGVPEWSEWDPSGALS